MKKFDFLLILACIACFIVLPVALKIAGASTDAGASLRVKVYSFGTLYGIYDLNTDTDIHISCKVGFNDVSIHGGSVIVCESDCRNNLCVNSKPISNAGESVACLPHGLFIIIDNKSNDYLIDGVAY